MKNILLSTFATFALLQTTVNADAITEQLTEVIKAYEDIDIKKLKMQLL
ncbi:hypothetical protein MNB_SV-13-1053 [hydrothermal vent metagenome]|uniref:Uncharacterized protein n=1 Tax=hydrothermal vent metagenome TaxID=652676 RepID=A0A1W1CP75_9ZZZZ